MAEHGDAEGVAALEGQLAVTVAEGRLGDLGRRAQRAAQPRGPRAERPGFADDLVIDGAGEAAAAKASSAKLGGKLFPDASHPRSLCWGRVPAQRLRRGFDPTKTK